jgi:hypothetical protein
MSRRLGAPVTHSCELSRGRSPAQICNI